MHNSDVDDDTLSTKPHDQRSNNLPAWEALPENQERNGVIFRMPASVRDGSVWLISRNGHSFTHLFGSVTDPLRGFPTSIVLDGEVIAINDKGQPDPTRDMYRVSAEYG